MKLFRHERAPQRHSYRLKLVLLASAAALTVGLFLLSKPAPQLLQPLSSAPPAEPAAPGHLTPSLIEKAHKLREKASAILEKPRFIGRDKYDRRWELNADQAVQERGETAIQMLDVSGNAFDAKGRAMAVHAKQGSFDETQKEATLEDNVNASLFGLNMNTPKVHYDLQKQELSGPVVTITGTRGKLEAGTYAIDLGANKARFSGQVKVTVQLGAPPEAPPQPTPETMAPLPQGSSPTTTTPTKQVSP